MPILINSATFTDTFGNSLGFYKSNTVDRFQVTFNVSSLIRMSSIGNPLSLDPSLNQVTSAGVSWLEEGFRVGQTVVVRIHSSGGAILQADLSSITYVDDVMCDFGSIPYWYNLANGEFAVIIALNNPVQQSVLPRATLDILFNHIKNSNPGSEFSLIDGEVSRCVLNGVESMSVGQTIQADLVGFQSGQFIESCSITRNTQQADLFYNHDITVTFMNSGMYDQSWFFSAEALKIFMKMEWAAVAGEPFARSEANYTFEGNTGFFNEPHNESLANSTINQTISELDYCVPTTAEIVVEGPLSELAIGSAYRSINDAYFKNKISGQQNLTMVVPTSAVAVTTFNSFQNDSGAGYDLTINSIVSVLNVHTINITFTPNTEFTTFMTNVEDGDRLMYLWVKCGNINWLAYESQLTCAPPEGGPLLIENEASFLDHCSNFDPSIDLEFPLPADLIDDVFDTEDDLGYIAEFFLEKNQIYESFNVKLEAFNTVTEEDFTLKQISFSFSAVQISGNGKYLLAEVQTVNSELPTTSVKRQAFLELRTNLETPTQYLVRLYAPWVLNWRYWNELNNANVDFYPTQNQNWEQYDNLTDWEIRTELSLIKEGLAFTHRKTLIDREYNADINVESEIEMIIDSSNLVVNTIPLGNLMRIKATHVNLLGPWNADTTWGMITIEETESNPRFICSSVVPYDNNTSNPLNALNGNPVIIIDFPSPEIAVLECYFNPDLLDLSNGACITSKIKDKEETVPSCVGMIYEDDDCIILENNNNLIIE